MKFNNMQPQEFRHEHMKGYLYHLPKLAKIKAHAYETIQPTHSYMKYFTCRNLVLAHQGGLG